MKGTIRKGAGRRSGLRFDAQNGVVTEALIFLSELDPEAIGPAMSDATHYEPTPVADFEALMQALPVGPEGFTFVDAGAGMGRMLLLASKRPFRQIVGVEVSAALCQVARDNIVRWRRSRDNLACTDLRVVCADVREYRFPASDAIVYLYNPFGEDSVQRLAGRIAAECSAHVYVLYHTAVHRAVFDEDARFEVAADLGFGVIYRKR